MNQIFKRSLAFLLALCMIVSQLPGLTLTADAAEMSGLSDPDIGLDYTDASNGGTVEWSANGTQIDGLVMGTKPKGMPYYKMEGSVLTITNNKGSNAQLSFDYAVETASGTVTIDGTAYTGTGVFTCEMASGETLRISLDVVQTGTQNSAKLTITNLSLIVDRDATTTFRMAENGSYTVTNAEGVVYEITADTQLVQHSSKAYTMEAAADEGYAFFGWYNVTTDSYLSYEARAVYQSDADQTIVPVFVSASTAIFEVGGAKFTDLGKAGAYAEASGKKQINLISSGTLSGSHTIPAGITLLIPFDDAYTCYTTEPANTTNPNNVSGSFPAAVAWVEPYAYKTLTLDSGAAITVEGAISISGQHSAGNSANGKVSYVGCPSGPVGFIEMAEDAQIVINDGGALYAWGYVIGDGTVTAKSGATVYENMQFTDFRGGSATLLMADPAGMGGEIGVFPLSQYYVQNVEVKLTLEAGANEYVYTSLFMSNMALSSGVKFMGEGAMFVAEEGGSISKEYLPDEDRLLIQVNGDAQINSLSLELGGTAVDSSDYTLPINSNITIQIDSGKTVINQNMALLPGSRVTIAQGAELNIAPGWSVYIYDTDDWDRYGGFGADGNPVIYTGGNFVNQGKKFIPLPFSPTRTYDRTVADLVDVKVDLNGKITADGYVHTTMGGAQVYSSQGTGIVHLVAGLDPAYIEMRDMLGFGFTFQVIQNGADITPAYIPTTSIQLCNADGSYTATEDAEAGEAYMVKDGVWVKMTDRTVSFDANGGQGDMDAITVTKDSILAGENTVYAPACAYSKTGHSFAGWATEEGGEAVYAEGDPIVVEDSLTLYAVWEVNTYTLTWVIDGQQTTQTYKYGEAIQAPAEPTREGHTFAGWDAKIPETMPAEDITVTLNATWTVNSYSLTWILDGEKSEPVSVAFGAALAAPDVIPEKEGHTFTGWKGEIPATMPANDLTISLTSGWEINSYNLIWVLDGEASEPVSVVYGTALAAPDVIPEKEGHTFLRWEGEIPATMLANDLTINLTSVWEVNTYTVTWIVDGVETTETYEYGEAIQAPADPQKVGYTFNGWTPAVAETMGAANETYTATWQINTWTLTWVVTDAEGYTKQVEETYDYGAQITMPEECSIREGYTFLGWADVSHVPAVMPDEDIRVELQGSWSINSYTVKFVVDGVTISEKTYPYGAAIEVPADPAKEDYAFVGWSPALSTTMGAGDVTYTATWRQITFTLTWVITDADGFYAEYIQELGKNQPVYRPTTFEREGYTFVEWVTPDGNYPAEMPEQNLTVELEGKWEINSYNVKFVVDGKTVSDETYTYGDKIAVPADPVKEGHTFTGWTPAVSETMGAGDVTYTATWSVNEYTVTWVIDGMETTETYKYGETIQVPADPEKVGYTFAGWTPAVSETMGAENVTYTAQFDINEYTVTWIVDGKETAETYKYGEAIQVPADPVKEGHTFTGWTPAVSETMGAGDVTYTATWSVNEYTVTWIVDGEKTTETYKYGETIKTPADPEKVGYTFTGWTPAVSETMGAADAVYTATWQINEYTVTWIVDGEKTTETYKYGETIKTPADPVKEGHTFTGWTPAVAETMGTGDLTYTATWSVNEYTVTWIVDGKETTQTYKYGETIQVPADPVKEGHTFTGWTPAVSETMGAADAVYTATWQVNEYTVTWIVDGEKTTETYKYGETIKTPADPVKEGYTFTGWAPAVSETMGAADVTYTAVFQINTYTLTWIIDGVTTTEQYVYGAAINAPAEPAKVGHTFAGWDAEYPATMPAGDITVTLNATWTVNEYTITWILDGVEQKQTCAYGAKITAPADPVKTGHTFLGWEGEIPETMPAGDITITLKSSWQVNIYKLTWIIDGETTVEEHAYGTDLGAPDEPEKEGHTFTGWEGDLIPDTMPAEDITIVLNSTWSVNVYTVTWILDDVVIEEQVAYGAKLVAPEPPEKEGYTFLGWAGGFPETMPAQDITITLIPSWEINIYTVTWIVDGVETVERYAYGTKIKIPEDPEKVGHTFAGWTPEVSETMGAANVTYTATWKVNTYTVTWVVDGVKTVETYEYGAEIQLPADPVKEGYTFTGWTPEVAKIMGAEDLVYHATWQISTYTINWVMDDGTVLETDVVAHGEVPVYNGAAPTKENTQFWRYTFAGWTPEIVAATADATYTAVFTETFVNPFVDVKESDYFYDSVMWAVQNGITNGTTPTTFSPGLPCERGAVVTFLWRAAGSPEPEKYDNPFEDVKESDYYYKAVLWAVEKGITNGMDAKHFAPTSPCTRAQVVTFLWRAMDKPAPTKTEHPFTDVTEDYYYEAMLWAVEEGITNGMTPYTFEPGTICQRNQIVTFLYRTYNK